MLHGLEYGQQKLINMANNTATMGHGLEDYLRDYPILGVPLAVLIGVAQAPQDVPLSIRIGGAIIAALVGVVALFGQWDQWQLRKQEKELKKLEIERETLEIEEFKHTHNH